MARKPRGPRDKTTTMRIHRDVIDALDRQAQMRGLRSRTQMLEQILIKWMNENPVKGQRLDGLQSLL